MGVNREGNGIGNPLLAKLDYKAGVGLLRDRGYDEMLEAICQYHAISAGNAEIGCDGIQALRYGTTDSDITSPKYPDYDLISSI